jgi:signal transduction histidine kinase
VVRHVRQDGDPAAPRSLDQDRALLADVTRRLATSLDLSAILVEVMRLLHFRFGYGNTAIFLADPGRRWLVLRAAYGEMVEPERDVYYRQRSDAGMVGEAFQAGQVVRVDDVQAHPRHRTLLPGVRSGLCVPLRAAGDVIGVLAVQLREAHALGDDDEALLRDAAEQLAPLLHNAALYEASERRTTELRVVAEIAHAISSQLTIDTLLDELHRQVARVMQMDTWYVALDRSVITAAWPDDPTVLDVPKADVPADEPEALPGLGDTDLILVRAYEGGERLADEEGRALWLRRGGAARAVVERRPVLRLRTPEEIATLDAGQRLPDASPHSTIGSRRRSASLLFAPLIAGDAVLGVFSVQSYALDAYDSWHAQLLGTLADQVAVALNNARLFAAAGEVEALRALDRLKDEFVATVSHELRTPLTSILGFAELIARPHQDARALLPALRPEQVERAAGEIYAAANHMRGILTDLLDLSRLAQRTLSLQTMPVAVGAVLAEAEALGTGASAGKHTIVNTLCARGAAKLHVLADPDRLRQVLLNLLDNAVRYSPPDTTVRLGARAKGGDVQLWVADEGVGMTTEQCERAFNRFWRGPIEVTSGRPGAGLGLAICRALVEAMHGRIWAESPGPGKGSTFYVTLPRAFPSP